MSFVSEHYSTVFHALVSDVQGGDTTPKDAVLQADTDDNSGIGSRLAKRAFDLSTQLLAASSNTQHGFESYFQGNSDGSSKSDVESDEVKPKGDRARQQPRAVSGSVPCPTLDSAVSDLHLVEELFAKSQDTALMSQQGQQDARIVFLSSVAAIHAHTISKLLEATLPLSADTEYWSVQGSSTLSVALYFIQSLPRRAYIWLAHTINAMLKHPATDGRNALERLYSAMPKAFLFPEIMAAATDDNRSVQTMRARLAVFRIPTNVNIMSLTRREIRNNQTQLAEFQERLAISIGMLSQVALMSNNAGPPDTRSETKPEALLQQVDAVLSDLNADIDGAGLSLDHSDLATMVRTTRSLVSKVQDIPLSIERCIRYHRRPSLLSRCWLPTVVTIVSAKHLSSYVYGHHDDLKEWIASGLVTLRNYVIQYILQPLRSGYETIRYGKHTYNVVTQASLESDFKSLENMVLAFAGRFGTVDPAIVKTRVENGDLSDVMRVYAQEMQKPFRNALFGDLVQAMLIQIQKVKVDVGQTMAALDKLLKSNELNFLLLSTVPATLSIYAAATWISSSLSWLMGGRKRNTITSIQLVVRDIDRLLNNSTAEPQTRPSPGEAAQTAATHGRLVCLTHYLRHHAKHIPNNAALGRIQTGAGWCRVLPHTRSLFLEDVRDIESNI
ncbi:Intraflagellar transport protein 88 [Coemansia sp. RSA 2559]|nr:Intraflagellar transport protein 88 [Coemansia sp. RSA 2559]